MTVNVLWLSLHDETPPRGYWDQAMLEKLFRNMWRPACGRDFANHVSFDDLPGGQGAIVVIPGQHHVNDVEEINQILSSLPWCLVVVAGDEDSLFPWEQLRHKRMNVWIMTPRADREYHSARLIGEGPAPDAYEMLPQNESWAIERPIDWFFAGQATHIRRHECIEAAQQVNNGLMMPTSGFAQGLSHEDYYRAMASAKFVPCPSGPCTQDSFRFFEALEAGCIPIADNRIPKDDGAPGYWQKVFGDDLPFPVIDDWATLPAVIDELRAGWPHNANKVFAWWQNYKRDLAYGLEDELDSLQGDRPTYLTPDDLITVLIPTSPIPDHPATEIIEKTIASVRVQLPTAEIIIMIDGVREEQWDRAADYQEYTRRLLWKCNHEWDNVLPIVFDEHGHQGNVTRAALERVRTPQILFVEHDTPVVGAIPWGALTAAIATDELNVIRLLHESRILPDYKNLMLDSVHIPYMAQDTPFVRTIQWSQRPHLASADFYREIIHTYFGRDSRTMIEDVMHGVVANSSMDYGWEKFKVAIYAPEGNIQRSDNLDGRKDDPKFDMLFDYDGGETPPYAPRRSPERDE